MNAVGGWGGVKLSITVDEVPYEVEFPTTKAYCSQPEFEPLGWEVTTENGKLIQKHAKYRGHWEAYFENVEDGDEELILALTDIITMSQMNRIPMILYPKYNEEGYSHNFSVYCSNSWALNDLQNKKSVAQRAKGIKFHSSGPISLSLEDPA